MGHLLGIGVIERSDEEGLKGELNFFHQLFGEDFYLELTRHQMREEDMKADGMDRESWLWQASIELQKKQERVFSSLVSACLMPNKDILFTIILFTVAQILVWLQLNGQFVWPIFKKYERR